MKKQESVFIIPNTYWHMHNNTGNENVGVVFVCWVIIRCYVCVIVLFPGIYQGCAEWYFEQTVTITITDGCRSGITIN